MILSNHQSGIQTCLAFEDQKLIDLKDRSYRPGDRFRASWEEVEVLAGLRTKRRVIWPSAVLH